MALIFGLPILGFLLGVAFIVSTYRDKKRKSDDMSVAVFCTFLLAGFGFVIGFLAALTIGANLATTWTVQDQTAFQSMEPRSSASDPFVLGTGSEDNGPVYFYNIPKRDGQTLDYVDAMGTVVKRQDRADGLLVTENKIFAHPWYNWIGLSPEDQRYTLDVPMNYVTKAFSAQ